MALLDFTAVVLVGSWGLGLLCLLILGFRASVLVGSWGSYVGLVLQTLSYSAHLQADTLVTSILHMGMQPLCLLPSCRGLVCRIVEWLGVKG